jgi:hypothetical protein
MEVKITETSCNLIERFTPLEKLDHRPIWTPKGFQKVLETTKKKTSTNKSLQNT